MSDLIDQIRSIRKGGIEGYPLGCELDVLLVRSADALESLTKAPDGEAGEIVADLEDICRLGYSDDPQRTLLKAIALIQRQAREIKTLAAKEALANGEIDLRGLTIDRLEDRCEGYEALITKINDWCRDSSHPHCLEVCNEIERERLKEPPK